MKKPSVSSCLQILAAIGLLVLSHRAAAEEPRPRSALPVIPDKVFNIVDNGAAGDGKTISTSAIQKTLDACATAGGGTVRVPAGDYLTGPLILGSGTRLEIAKDAVLRFDNRIESFPKNAKGYVNCIFADKAHDIEICGPGKIDGQGAPWWKAFAADKEKFPRRPMLILVNRCERVRVHDITLVDSPQFHLVPSHCLDVTIENVTVNAPADSPNTDAIDPSGWNIFITGCTLDVGDDNIALKPSGEGSTEQPSCENITITHCAFLHGHGLSIGGQTEGCLRGLRVEDCTFNGTTNGIRMKATRENGGVVQEVSYDRITMTDVKNPVLITSYYPKAPAKPEDDPAQPANTKGPIWKNIMIRNLTATGSKNAGVIWSVPELPAQDITFDHVKISAAEGMRIYNAKAIRFSNSEITAAKGEKLLQYNAGVSGL